MVLADRLQVAWYGGARPPWWTWPLAGLYGGLTALRRSAYRLGLARTVRLPVPVIVVGNLTVGGTGKTPLTLALVDLLRARGWKPGVVSRGYGGTQRDPLLLDTHPDPARVGDEPSLIRISGAPVAVGRDRPEAARLLLGEGCDVIVADDGLQHYRLARDVEICVIDGARGFGNGRLLPAGPLREPTHRLRRVDFCIRNLVSPDACAAPHEVPMRLHSDEAYALAGDVRVSLRHFQGRSVHAVAGIGHPERFFKALRAQGIAVIPHAFPDHHSYIVQDVDFHDGLPVLMTDKDAVKCRRFGHADMWRVPVHAVLPEGFIDTLLLRLTAKAGARGALPRC